MDMLINAIVKAVITIIVAAVTGVVIPVLREWITAKIGEEKTKALLTWAAVAVNAAEQLFTNAGAGVEKKNYVITFLKDKGFNVSADVEAAIEAAVYDMNNAIFEGVEAAE